MSLILDVGRRAAGAERFDLKEKGHAENVAVRSREDESDSDTAGTRKLALLETFPAKDRPALCGSEWDRCLFAAGRAVRGGLDAFSGDRAGGWA